MHKSKHEQHPWLGCAHKCKLQECKYMEMAILGMLTSLQGIKTLKLNLNYKRKRKEKKKN